jgi:hypothetical protein
MNELTTYYVETEGQYCGELLLAANDEDALLKMPKDTICLYKESDTPDGLPFIFIYERNKTNE